VRRRAVKPEPALTPGRGGAQRSRLDLDTAQFGGGHVMYHVMYHVMQQTAWASYRAWTGAPDNPSAAGVISAMTGAIGAARACAAREHASRNAPLTRVSPSSYVLVPKYWRIETSLVVAGL